jgi:4a-hydroxytetrahydrobiopterin dehydratase
MHKRNGKTIVASPASAGALSAKRCVSCEGGVKPLDATDIRRFLACLPGWKESHGEIAKTYAFENYYQTMAFVNATAWISHQENHHPDLEVGYNKCRVRYSTHSVGGLSENDFVCAAKVEALTAAPPAAA